MYNHQAPAVKPSHLIPKSIDIQQPKSPTALHGATSAFLIKTPSLIVKEPSTSNGARIAASTAGRESQWNIGTRQFQKKDESTKGSPPRGRQLDTNVDFMLSAARASSTLNVPNQNSTSLIRTRSSSTLAARHATTQRISPHRSPNRSPRRDGQLSPSHVGTKYEVNSADALSGASASVSASAIRRQGGQNESTQPAKSSILNFEKIPQFSRPGASRSLTGSTDSKSSATTTYRDPPHFSQTQSQSPDQLLGGQSPPTISIQYQKMPTKIVRQSSEESAMTATTTTAISTDDDKESVRKSRSVFPIQTSTYKISPSRSPPKPIMSHHDSYRNTMTVNALADAMVASSLASSRAASPSKGPPPPTSKRRSRSVTALYEFDPHLDAKTAQKSTKAVRSMKHTLRKQAVSDDEEVELAKRGRRHWMRKHPNMHSEGDRKRWRDKVTERERRRYEGVFAANRGLFIGPGHFQPSASTLANNQAEGNQVVNVIVRDIWERSRLPREVLKEIYDLVSPEESQSLNREQFVVGLWLIDQRLKGRKLPVKVSISVWSSVRHSQGIKIRRQVH